MSHKIYVTKEVSGYTGVFTAWAIKKIVEAALKEENVDVPCEVSVLITDDQHIRQLNSEFRSIDKATDVLSFPLQELIAGAFACDASEIDRSTGLLPLGDIVISAERTQEQATEFGHSLQREMTYLTVHSVLHLLGYDHVDEGEDKRKMRAKEKKILAVLGIED